MLGESARHVGQVVVPPASDLTATSLSPPKELWLSILSEALGIDIYETFTWRIKLTETQFRAFLGVSSFRRITPPIALTVFGTPLEASTG